MDVRIEEEKLNLSHIIITLLQEFNAMTDYRILRDHLPRRLAHLLNCHAVLMYLRQDEALQLVAGACHDQSNWSSTLLSGTQITPISINSSFIEARCWREQEISYADDTPPQKIVLPLLYSQQCIGVLVLVLEHSQSSQTLWQSHNKTHLEAIAAFIGLLLENTRLLERDRERIHELSLLNSISSQLNRTMYDQERLRQIVIQRTKEICTTDFCELLEPHVQPDVLSWIPPTLIESLFAWYQEKRSPWPLILEKPGQSDDEQIQHYLELLPEEIKTFIALPLFRSDLVTPRQTTGIRSHLSHPHTPHQSHVLGIIVGGYYRHQKIEHAALTLLQVLANQASIVLENSVLMSELLEARNETRKLLHQVLDNQRQKELILESIPNGLITVDLKGSITTFNRAAATILGYHPYEVFGLPLRNFLPLSIEPETSDVISHALSTNESTATKINAIAIPSTPKVAQQIVTTKDRFERERTLEIETIPLHDDREKYSGTLVIMSDMTTLHQLEEEKRRLDRLATLGEMAANVAHEVRNPLASIKTSIHLLRDDLLQNLSEKETLAETEESMTVMLKEVERLDSLVHDLLLFARPRRINRTQCQLIDICEQALLLVQRQHQQSSIVIHRIYEQLPFLWVDRGQVEQILLNLLLNAIQAMPEGGILTIECHHRRNSRSTDKHLSYGTYIYNDSDISQHQQWAECIINDTGIGITPEQLERIFHPFFTTKAHGIGLGLPITRRLIEDHGGTIRIESQLGYGTTVIVRFPITDTDQ